VVGIEKKRKIRKEERKRKVKEICRRVTYNYDGRWKE
jgi:hypothetical protein